MADSSGKKEQTDSEGRVEEFLACQSNEFIVQDASSTTAQEKGLSEDINSALSSSDNSSNECKKQKEKQVVDKSMDKAFLLNVQPTTSTIHENNPSNFSENLAKRSKDKADNKKDISYDSDGDSDEDSSKKQKLNEQPNTSMNDSENYTQDASKFSIFNSKIKTRNYRSQNSSSDQAQSESMHEDSNSSESIEQEARDGNEDSSDERSEALQDNGDSNEWTSASENDTDEIPAVLQKEPSKSNWSIIKDVINRQIGFNNSIQCRFYGSLHAVQRLELMYKLEDHLGCVNSLGFNQKGNLLASASDDLTVTIWDWAIGKKYVALQTGHRSNVFQSKWLPLDVECSVVSCARDGQIRLIDVQSKVTRKLAQHQAPCHKISTHLDLPHIILSAGEDSKVLSIDIRENKPTKLLSVRYHDHNEELYSIHSNPLNNFEFCVAGQSRFVKIYDRRKPTTPLHQLCPNHLMSDEFAQITCAVYNYNGTEIIASYNNEDIYLFDIATTYQSGDFAHKYQGHRNSATVKGVNFFGPNSEFILSGSDCGNIFIWDKKTEAIVQWMPGDEQGIVNALEPHPHIPILATSGLDYDVKIWIPSREEAPNIKQKLQSCIKKNLTARAKMVEEAESAFDGQVLWVMLRDIRHAERQRHHLLRRIGNRDENNDFDDENDDNIDDDSSSDADYNYSESDSHSES